MDTMLQKMAGRLNQYDEASLTALWEKYFRIVQEYEPTETWEHAVLILNMIQAVRWKNQLFNYHLSREQEGAGMQHGVSRVQEKKDEERMLEPVGRSAGSKNGKILSFRPRKPHETR